LKKRIANNARSFEMVDAFWELIAQKNAGSFQKNKSNGKRSRKDAERKYRKKREGSRPGNNWAYAV
jgi:hypothetical protein